MGNLKKKLGRRILAYLLSGAMIMSGMTSPGMTAFASESPDDTGGGYYEETVVDTEEAEETAEETEVKETEEASEIKASEIKASETETSETETFETRQVTETEASDEEETSDIETSETEVSETETESSLSEETKDSQTEVLKDSDGPKIDVWDFGAKEEENAELYNNNITSAEWLAYKDSIGSDGKFTKGGDYKFGDVTITGVLTNDRLYSNVSGLDKVISAGTNYAGKSVEGDDYTSAGVYYCNGSGGINRRLITIENVQAGNKIVLYMGNTSSGKSDTVHFAGQDAASAQDDTFTLSETIQKQEFIAEYAGTYKIYADTAGSTKPIYYRVKRVPAVNVTGTVDFGPLTSTDGVTLKFVNQETKGETTAALDGTSFTAKLAAGYTYNAVLSGATGYGFTNASKAVTTTDAEAINGKDPISLVVESKSTYTYSGKITGFAEGYNTSNLKVTMKADPDSQSDDVVLAIADDLSFTATLEPDVAYTIAMEGVNDYEITSELTVNQNQAYTADITVALKAKYDVTGGFVDLDGNAVTGVTALVFTNVDDSYTYEAAVADGASYSVSLRDGSYSAAVTIENYTTSTHVVVGGAAVSKNLLLVSTVAGGTLTRVADLYVGDSSKENNYNTVSEAVKAAKLMNPSNEEERITIHIAPGTYREQIIVNAPYITFKNDSPSKEVLLTWYYGIGYQYYSADKDGYYNPENAYDQYEKRGADRWGCAVRVRANYFKAENITFENSFNRYITDEELADGVEVSGAESITFARKYGADVQSKAATERAAAIAIDADCAEFYQCSFYGSQDTLYTSATAYFKNCLIEGMTDYIFGDGNIVFDSCELSWKGYSSGGQGGYITAAKDAASHGYLFRNCTVTANEELTVDPGYFGRPWGQNAKVTFVNTKLEKADLIVAAGWTDMSGATAAKANFKEYNTTALDGGTITPVSPRSDKIVTANPVSDVTAYFGSWTPSHFAAEADGDVAISGNVTVTDNADINTPKAGNTLTVHYSLGDNDSNDASIIRWYTVEKDESGNEKADTEKLVKASTASAGKTYKIAAADNAVGKYIKVTVTPQTISGKSGEAKSYTLENPVAEGYEDPSIGGDITLGEGINIFLAGDSTVKDYSAKGMYNSGSALNEGSWGEFIQSFFNESQVTIQNYAQGGRSCRTFINEGKLTSIADNIKKGDYLFIQFGHNDCADTYPDRYVPVGTPDADGNYPSTAGTPDGNGVYPDGGDGTFKWFLTQYINVAKEKGATPVLVTPVARMYYNSDGTIKTHHDSAFSSNNAYVTAVEQLAKEQDVLLIDGYGLTKNLFEAAWTACGSDTYGKQIMASGDKTHNNKLGGLIEAAAIAQTIQDMNLNISRAVKAPAKVLGETTGGVTVFSVNGNSVLTAYDINSDYADRAAYWEGIGQAMINAIAEKASEFTPENPENPDNPNNPGDSDDDTDDGDEGEKITVGETSGEKVSIDGDKIKVSAANLVYTKKKQYAVTVTYTNANGKQQQLTEGVHYNVTLKSGDATAEGTHTLTVSGTGLETDTVTLTGKKDVTYTIIKQDAAKNDTKHNIAKLSLSLNKDEVKAATYKGAYITPTVDGLTGLTEGTDYIAAYKNNVNAGKATVTIIGQGSYYGTKTLTFNIKKAAITSSVPSATNAVFNDTSAGKGKSYEAKDPFVYKGSAIKLKNFRLTLEGNRLSSSSDYTVTYKNNAKAGKATATVKGMNNLSGSIKITYDIKTDDTVKNSIGTKEKGGTSDNPYPAEFSSKGAKLTEIKIDEITLKEGTDYTVKYTTEAKNAKADDNKVIPVTVTGKNSYKNDFKNKEVFIKVEKGSYHYKDGAVVDNAKLKGDETKKKKAIISAAKITDAAGKAVNADDVTITPLSAANTVTVTPKNENSGYKETVLKNCRIADKLANVKVVYPDVLTSYYDSVNAVALTKADIIKACNNTLKETDFKITSYKNNNKVGKATVTITATDISAYYGTMNINFTIKPYKTDPVLNPDKEEESSTEESSSTEPSKGDETSTEPATDSEEKAHTIWVVGDSTVSSFTDNYYYPRYGYGTQIRNYETGYYDVNNLALSGRSSKSFLSEANYTTLKDGIGEGDVLIIGFGHNDEKADEPDRYTDPKGDYQTEGSFAKSLYDNYVKLASDKGAQPILCTPIVRRNPSGDTLADSQCHITSSGDYAQAIRDLGTAVNVPVVDLTALTKAYYERIGCAETLYLHAWTSNKETSVDNTHLNIYGAKVVAHMLATELGKLTDKEISKHITNIKNAPTKEKDLVVNPDYKVVDYTAPTKGSTIWPVYGIFKGSVFGPTIDTGKSTLKTDNNGNMNIAVTENKGKIASTEDSIAMYYYQIPAASTFTLSATATINALDVSKSGNQVAFGLMARDDMYIDTKDANASDYVAAGTFGASSTNCFRRKDGTLTPGGSITDVAAGQSYDLKIVRNVEGYACTFGDNDTQSGGYDFNLTSVDAEYQYIGMFAARNIDVSFSNIKLTVDGVEINVMDTSGSDDDNTGGGTTVTDFSIEGDGGPVEISTTDGLKANAIYGYKSVATFEALEDMPFYEGVTGSDGKYSSYAFDLDGVSYTGCVQGSNGPGDSHAAQSGKAVFKIKAVTDSKITFVTRENAKNLYFVNESDISDIGQNIAKADRGAEGTGKSYSFNLKAGNTYYFYAGGSKVMVAAVSIAKTAQ